MNSRDTYFDEDYFQNGIKTHKSLYKNFSWTPLIAFSIASALFKLYKGKSILDFGCAMGYVVYALRLLGITAYGYDISKYAIDNCKEEVRNHLFTNLDIIPKIDVVFGKDVLEHIPYSEITTLVKHLRGIGKEACFVIPLGEHGEYRIPEYAYDGSHIIIENEEWWVKLFTSVGFKIAGFDYHVPGIKDNWYERYKYGNCVIMLE